MLKTKLRKMYVFLQNISWEMGSGKNRNLASEVEKRNKTQGRFGHAVETQTTNKG